MFTTLQHTTTRPFGSTPAQPAGDPWLSWRIATHEDPEPLSVAELADCRCPDLCDRDHANE